MAEKLTLADSIKFALENNPSVRIAEENVHRARATIHEATAIGMPKLTLEGIYQRLDEIASVTFGERTVELGTLDSRTADLTLLQPVDVFGAVKTARRAARSIKSGSEHDLAATTNNTTLEVKQAYLNVLREQKKLVVYEGAILILEAHLKDAQAHYNAGTIARFDVLRAETELANARPALITARNGVELAKSAFNNVLGRGLDASVDLEEPRTPEFVQADLVACVQSACGQRPEVLRADTQVDVSDIVAKGAELAGKPRFNLRWAYNRNFDSTVFNPRESSWRAFFTASVSIFDGGATRASVDKAESDAQNARSAREQVVQGVTLDAKQAYLSLNESRERIAAAEKGLEQARESVRLAQVRYKGGVSTQLEVLDAQAALTIAETNHVNAYYDYQVALARLERAVGGSAQFAKLVGETRVAQRGQ
jgi:outer membrane protein TolC